MPRPTRSHRGGGRLSSLSRDFLRRETKHDCGHDNIIAKEKRAEGRHWLGGKGGGRGGQ